MKRVVKCGTGLFLLAIVVLFGCSRPVLPVKLASQIVDADRVVVSDWADCYRISLTNDDVSKLVRAVSSAKRERLPCSCIYACQIDFYKGTNWLGVIHSQSHGFLTDEGEPAYSDDTGVLKTLQLNWRSDINARKTWMNDWAGELKRKPELSELQKWSQEVLQRCGTNQWKRVSSREIPDWLRSAFSFYEADILRDPTEKPECLFFSGGGYYFLAGPTNYTTTFQDGCITNAFNIGTLQDWYITNVQPGVYVFRNINN